MSKVRMAGIKMGSSNLGGGLLVAALLFGVGCERGQPEAAQNEALTDGTEVSVDGSLVVDWNNTAFEAAYQVDTKYEDPFPHLRALTMMHLAMHDAANGVQAKYARFALESSDERADPTVAAAAAAHAVLNSIYPEQRELFDAKLSEFTAGAPKSGRERGLELGEEAAQAVLASRASDHSDENEPYVPKDEPGRHRFVPPFELVYRPGWRHVVPFALESGDQFRSAPPPALDSEQYAADYEEVRNYGRLTDATRTKAQSFYADWWYELSEIGWNRIARVTWAKQSERDLWFTARLFALLNVGLMDAYIAGWDSKLYYDFWRPYTAIRAGATDQNDTTVEESDWESYCVTPPVQDYPSTHSALGAAAAAILYQVYGGDVPFTMESTSSKPPGQPHSLTSFEQAALENADSRVACGIHFRFATEAGLELGERVGEQVLASLLAPVAQAH